MYSLSSILENSVKMSKCLEEENTRLALENQELKAELKGLNDKVNLIMQRLDRDSLQEVETTARREFRELSQELKDGGAHPMNLTHRRNREILDKFMDIFDKAPDADRKWLATEPMCPSDMKFPEPKHYSDLKLTHVTTRPLHSIFFLADSEALNKLKPYLNKSDFEAKCLLDSSFLHMIISGIEHDAPQENAPKCAKILLSQAPELRNKKNKLRTTADDYAQYLISQLRGFNKEKDKKLRDVSEAINS